MENHPIPQDVTGFKFKLVGSITLKEFLYILAGGILATVVFILPAPPLIFRIPFMLMFGGIGAALAFIPVDGRPMDKMIYNFLKTVPSENQYIYHKRGLNLHEIEYFKPLKPTATTLQTQNPQTSQASKRDLFYSQLKRGNYNVDPEELALLQNVKSYFDEPSAATKQSAQASVARPVTLPSSPNGSAVVNLPKGIDTTPVTPARPVVQTQTQQVVAPTFSTPHVISVENIPSKQEVAQSPTRKPINTDTDTTVHLAHVPNTPFHINQEEIAQATIQENQNKNLLSSPSAPQPAPTGQEFQFRQKPAPASQPTVAPSTPSQQAQIRAGFPTLPDKPNIILGIVRDARGKVLPHILVEVLDANGLSVRAFKTNLLGQFASATPLPNGQYSVLLNDPATKQEFPTIKVNLDGKIFQPVEIVSTDAREKLRQELFGAAAA